MSLPASLVALYVPGSRPDRFDRAAATGAEVILDLEDSVAAADKEPARSAVAEWLRTCGTAVQVRVNAPGTRELAADLEALPVDVPIRMPKVERPDDLVPVADRTVHALLESALGVENAHAVGSAPCVVSLALGEADLAAELGLDGEAAFDWMRSRLVVASAAAGLPAPMMAAYPAVRDLDGLAASCRHGRALGMRGRTAVHPTQVPVIRSVFAPTDAELAWAREVLGALEATGVASLADGSMVDAAMARRARAVLSEGRDR
ncbi:MAG: CoA ester lyase [Actinomycetota bacterium]|nr:CoA ester lyase [Actinomycetota bacterium]